MASLETLKQEIREEASENPEKFFATSVLKERGFKRGKCSECGTYFWSSEEDRKVCGEPECSGGYTFIGDSPVPEEYSYIESWELYRDHMSSRGYKVIDRYPVVARWRDDTDFVEAAIYNFQPHVVSGEVEPPAPELVVPQPSLRFNDIDNVGVTGRHYVLHNHISQTCFQPPEKYDQDRYFRDLLDFALDVLEIPEDKLVLHEDAWGGGGNLGASMEFFVDGLELWNQVYMFYRVTEDGYEELDLKVLDMGMGHERITWISHGSETSYECVMPSVLEKMKDITGVEVDKEVWRDFLPHSGNLNVDEVEDIEQEWKDIAVAIGVSSERLKDSVRPVADLYSVAEHVRALLFAIGDGKLPSNTGGGHNLRVILRRSLDLVERNGWDLDLKEIVEWHAEELEPMFPELKDNVGDVQKILEVEEEKYRESREDAERKLETVENPSVREMVELYESHGVSPEMMEKHGVEVPDDFYSHLTEEEEEKVVEEDKFNIKDFNTEKLYYGSPEPYLHGRTMFTAEVVDTDGQWVILDRTMFYPEGGGQEPDKGTLEGEKVVDVQEQGETVLHKVPGHSFSRGDELEGIIDSSRREQLTQHHTATHLVNAAAKEVLGGHIWQAGASKKVDKARLDVTHFEKPSEKELEEIEGKVEEYISRDIEVERFSMSKREAEDRYGFRIYQGGTVPGNTVRLISIGDVDVEACGGTHVESTHRVGEFMVTGCTKVQDGVVRIEYRAGDAAVEYLRDVERRVEEVADFLDAEVGRSDYRQVEKELCEVLDVEPGQLLDTVERFVEENNELKKRIGLWSDYLDEEDEPLHEKESGGVVEVCESLYSTWKENEKVLEGLEASLKSHVMEEMEDRYYSSRVPTNNIGLLIQVAKQVSKDQSSCVVLEGEKGAVAASHHEDFEADEELKEKGFKEIQGDETFAKAFG